MSLHKSTPVLRKKQGRYHAVFYDPETRKRYSHTLGTNKKDVATRRFNAICRAYDADEFDPKRDKYQFDALTLRAATEEFIAQQGRYKEWAPKTVQDYTSFLNLVCETLPAGIQLVHLNASDCRKVIGSAPAPATRKGYYTRLRSFLNWAVKKKYIKVSPLSEIREPKVTRKAPEYFTREEVSALVHHALEKAALSGRDTIKYKYVRLARVIRFGVATGLRLEEFRRLAWKDVDRGANRINVVGKGNKYRPVPLFPDALEVLKEIESEHESQFITKPHRDLQVFAGLPYYETSHEFRRILDELGFGKEYSFHSLRKTFASWAVMAGVNIFTVSKWLGHASVLTTERAYAYLAPGYVPDEATEAFGGEAKGVRAEMLRRRKKRRLPSHPEKRRF